MALLLIALLAVLGDTRAKTYNDHNFPRPFHCRGKIQRIGEFAPDLNERERYCFNSYKFGFLDRHNTTLQVYRMHGLDPGPWPTNRSGRGAYRNGVDVKFFIEAPDTHVFYIAGYSDITNYDSHNANANSPMKLSCFNISSDKDLLAYNRKWKKRKIALLRNAQLFYYGACVEEFTQQPLVTSLSLIGVIRSLALFINITSGAITVITVPYIENNNNDLPPEPTQCVYSGATLPSSGILPIQLLFSNRHLQSAASLSGVVLTLCLLLLLSLFRNE